jgi:hypothetical protein
MMSANDDLTFVTTSVNWSGVAVDFGGMSKTYGDFKLVGSGNTVSMTTIGDASGYDDGNLRQVAHSRPLIRDFTHFYPDRLRDGNLMPLLGVRTFNADPRYPWTLDPEQVAILTPGKTTIDAGDPVAIAAGELRTRVGVWLQSAGLVSGLDYDDPDYAHGLLETNALYFTKWSRAS